MSRSVEITVHSTSRADDLGYLGQDAVWQAVGEGGKFLVVGGHMVRLLLHVYPTAQAAPRSTLDADAAIGSVEVLGPVVDSLLQQQFTKESANFYTRTVEEGRQVEINLLLPRTGHAAGIRSQNVPGIGRIDTLPELSFAMDQSPLELDVTAELSDRQTLAYRTRIPDLEAAVVLKAHSWENRRATKDLADLASLLEIRQEHQDAPWKLDHAQKGVRKDAAQILQQLGGRLSRRRPGIDVPDELDGTRLAGLIVKHVQ